MCGICAVLQPKADLDQTTLIQMTRTLTHRGPDDWGAMTLCSDYGTEVDFRQEANVGLGHTRLAIIDLSSAGHQPMKRRENGPVIVFNGEIYNYRELRQIFERNGVVFRSDSDTEVLLAAYDAWQQEMLPLLNGMFAFVLWDPDRQEMLVARDRLGIKPLYYYEKDGCFACASELKALLAYPDFKRELNLPAVQQYLVKGWIPGPHTIFQNTYKLLPGHFLRVQHGKIVQLTQYWDPLSFYQPPAVVDEVTATVTLDKLLRSAVRSRMISDVPLGALLSGGIDSSLIVALMQEQSTQSIKTFTIGFDTVRYNEAGYAAAVAKYLGTDHHELIVNEQNLLNFVPNLVKHYDEPFADTSAIPTFVVSVLARQHVTVALSGDGGDETHLGYPTYQWMEQREQMRRWVPEPIMNIGAAVGKQIPQQRIRRMSQYLSFKTPQEAHQWVVSYWPWSEAQSLLNGPQLNGQLLPTAYESTFEHLTKVPLLQRMAAADLTSYMVDDILTKVDRASMAVALEVRVPLLDHRVVEYVAGLPLSMKRGNGVSKYLLRKLLYRRVPRELVDRSKQGFSVPMAEWLRGPLRDLLQSMLVPAKLNEHGLFNINVINRHMNEHLSGSQDHSKKLWNLLVFQMWYDCYLGQAQEEFKSCAFFK